AHAVDPVHLLEHLATGLGLLGLLASEVTPDELFGSLDELLLLLVPLLSEKPPFVALHEIGRIVARVDGRPAVVHLDDAIRGSVEQKSVVRDDDVRGPIRWEKVLEPLDGLYVEVVRGL